MSRRPFALALGLLAVVLVLALLWRSCGRPEAVAPGTEEEVLEEVEVTGEERAAELYFPGRGSRLYPEARPLPAAIEGEERIERVVRELLAGPRGEGLYPAFPEGLEVANVYLSGDGIVYVDLRSPENAPPPAGGSRQELLTVYSLVNTVLANAPDGSRSVVLLWNGRQRPTYNGHLDTGRPLAADRRLVAGG